MPIVRRSRRLSDQTLPDPLEQCVPGGFDFLDIPYPAIEPPTRPSVAATTTTTNESLLSPETIEYLSAFADQRELAPPDPHSQCRRRKGKNGNAPRPPNAFMLFRSDFWRFNKDRIPERDHRQISRLSAHCWNALDEHRRVPYQELARQLKDEHAQLYPQHKYNLPAKERASKKIKKEEINDAGLCGIIIIAAKVTQDVRASEPPKILGSSEGGLLDQVIEQKVNLKRPRSASAVAVVEKASDGEAQPFQRPAKKRKRNLRKPSTAAIPVSVVQSQADASHSPTAPFIPTNEIPTLALPPSRNSPAVKVEPYQELVLQLAAQIATVKKEPTVSPSPVVRSPKMESPELGVPELPASMSPQFPPFNYEPPVEYVPSPTDPIVDEGLQISEDYGLSRPTEVLDFSYFGYADDTPAVGLADDDEFAEWCRNPN